MTDIGHIAIEATATALELVTKLPEPAAQLRKLRAELDAVTAERDAARKPWCVHLPRGITVSIDAIESVEIDSRHYMNGSSTYLVVKLRSGTTHRFEHAPHYLDGVDVHKLHKEICDA